MPKITGEIAAGELEIKHLYFPGVVISDTCPNCGKECSTDLGRHATSYPIVNKPTTFGMYCGDGCDGCEHEWEVPILLTFKMEIQ
jgi:hypothetical protein